MIVFPPVKPTILVVDDSVANLSFMATVLRDHYTVKVAKDGVKGIQLAQNEQPDMVLIDVMMPGLDGYDVCRMLKVDETTQHIPVILLTSQTESDNEQKGLDLGAVDYITRPINPVILLSRVRAHYSDAQSSRAMRINNEYLEFEVAKRARQVTAMQDITILAMASLSETRDTDTGNHLKRTQSYVRALANQLKMRGIYKDFLNDEVVEILYKCAPLHDIGKVGIPDRILHKPGRYTPDEYEIMKTHPELGRAALENAQRIAGGTNDFLEIAKEVVYCHHERWDGTGYPQGLAGDEIPVSARLMSLADVYDALISPRIYKPGMSHDDASELIVQGSGTQFDPVVVDAFLDLTFEFRAIAHRHADSDLDLAEKAEFAISALGTIP